MTLHYYYSGWVGVKCVSGKERNPEFDIWCGSLEGGERQEERGMSSVRQVSLPKMNFFVIVGNCRCDLSRVSHQQQGGAPPITASAGKPRLHGKPQTLCRFRRLDGELSQILMSLRRNQIQNWEGAETLRAARAGKVVEDYSSWWGGGFQYCKLVVLKRPL